MRQQTRASKEPAEKVVQDIRRATRKHYSAEEKIRIVLEGLRGEDSSSAAARGSSRTFITAPVDCWPGATPRTPRDFPLSQIGEFHAYQLSPLPILHLI